MPSLLVPDNGTLGCLPGAAHALRVSAARFNITQRNLLRTLAQLHRELQDSLHQLQAIRAELRSGISLTNPGCVPSSTASFTIYVL